jgi:nitroreductase
MRAEEIRQVVELAIRAPSIHNTQPWRFKAADGVPDLYADRSRQLAYLDPLGRQLTFSCGAALLFARLALSATGLSHRVEILPDHDDFDHLARIVVDGFRAPTPDELLLTRVIPRRATARGRFVDGPLPASVRKQLETDAAAEGGWLLWVDSPADRAVTAVLVTRATRIEEADPDYRARSCAAGAATPPRTACRPGRLPAPRRAGGRRTCRCGTSNRATRCSATVWTGSRTRATVSSRSW